MYLINFSQTQLKDQIYVHISQTLKIYFLLKQVCSVIFWITK